LWLIHFFLGGVKSVLMAAARRLSGDFASGGQGLAPLHPIMRLRRGVGIALREEKAKTSLF
jgi:hypothetical protein